MIFGQWDPVQVRNSEFLDETFFDHAKWQILTVANTRQMVPGKKVKIKFQNLSKKNTKTLNPLFHCSGPRHLVGIKFEVANSGGRLWFESWKKITSVWSSFFFGLPPYISGVTPDLQLVFRAITVGGGVHVCLECRRSRSTSRGSLWCWHASTPNWGCLAGRKDKGPQKDLFQCVFPPGLASLTIRHCNYLFSCFCLFFFAVSRQTVLVV